MRDYRDTLRLLNRNVRLFLMATAVHGFVFFGIYTLLLNLYLLRLGFGPEQIGLVNGVGPLMLAAFSLPAGAISRRLGSRRVLMWSYAGMALCFGLMPLSEWLPAAWRLAWIVTLYAGGWIGGAFAIVNFAPYLMVWTGIRERDHAFALQSASFPVAGFLGSLMGGALPDLFATLGDETLTSPVPYRNALLTAAVLELLAVVVIQRTIEVKNTAVGATGPVLRSPPPYRLMLLFGLISLTLVGGEWTMRVYYNVYLDGVLAVPTTIIGAVSAGALLMGLAAFIAPQAAARWGHYRLIRAALFTLPAAFLPLILVRHWLAVGLGYMILVATVSLIMPVYGVFSQSLVDDEWRTALSSASSMAVGLGIAATSLSGGWVVAAYGFQTLFVLGALAPLAGALVFGWFFRTHAAGVREAPAAD